MRATVLAGLIALLTPALSLAQTADATVAADAPIRDVDAVVVSGVQPGPGMWKVSKGDHVMYVLGTLSPLPNEITWQSKDVEDVIAQAGTVLDQPGMSINSDIGFFRGMLLVPAALKATKNPEGAMLKDVLPADLYARWLLAKNRYIGRDEGIEKKRPLLAANELYQQALSKSGLGKKPIVSPVIEAAMKPRKLKSTQTGFKFTIDDPKAALKELQKTTLDDVGCMRVVLDRLDSDLALATARANAWAVGDIETLRNLASKQQMASCLNAVMQTEVARKRGIVDIEARVEKSWLAAVDSAMAQHPVTFAQLSINELLKPDGYLAKLQAKGYSVEAPE